MAKLPKSFERAQQCARQLNAQGLKEEIETIKKNPFISDDLKQNKINEIMNMEVKRSFNNGKKELLSTPGFINFVRRMKIAMPNYSKSTEVVTSSGKQFASLDVFYSKDDLIGFVEELSNVAMNLNNFSDLKALFDQLQKYSTMSSVTIKIKDII